LLPAAATARRSAFLPKLNAFDTLQPAAANAPRHTTSTMNLRRQ
jgi:hypothetical protein